MHIPIIVVECFPFKVYSYNLLKFIDTESCTLGQDSCTYLKRGNTPKFAKPRLNKHYPELYTQ